MALTQQFARVSPEYLAQCRESALGSPGAAPGWAPPSRDLLDADWALWGLIWYCRKTAAHPRLVDVLGRALTGDPGGDIGFLDHDEVYDAVADPPGLLAPAAVDEITRALFDVDIGRVLADLPQSPEAAASVVGFEGFRGNVRDYLVEHFLALRAFFRGAQLRGQCVVVWID
ncbi:DUF1877 domain-containing protein [Streptomyces sp. NBC_00996]|uniref:DUF1877 domain-containing protein n=1 Tax=Streptomyces sp. NBC_00996 TaxID=2903710 RepID=UPI003868CB06|nr:YfbM family protein [Streptomyces sp. NBC_00996]